MKIFLHLIISVGLMNMLSCQSKEETKPSSFVASISAKVASVYHKRARTFEWKETSLGEKLDNFDSVRTEQNSQARIDFIDGGSLEVEENSLVLILDRKVKEEKIEQNVALPKGRIEGVIPKGKHGVELLVKTPSGWVSAKSTKDKSIKFNVSVKNKITIIKAVQGKILVQVKDEQREIPQGLEVTLKVIKLDTPTGSDYREDPVDAKIVFAEVKEVIKAPIPIVDKPLFKITKPSELRFETDQEFITFSGIIKGGYEVYLNGQSVPSSLGVFKSIEPLKLGMNIFTFQAVLKKKVVYKIFKVVRRNVK